MEEKTHVSGLVSGSGLVNCGHLSPVTVLEHLATFADPACDKNKTLALTLALPAALQHPQLVHYHGELAPLDFSRFPFLDLTDFDRVYGPGSAQALIDQLLAPLRSPGSLAPCPTCDGCRFTSLSGCTTCLIERLTAVQKQERREFLVNTSSDTQTLARFRPQGFLVGNAVKPGMWVRGPILAAQFVSRDVMRCIGLPSLNRMLTYEEHDFSIGSSVRVNIHLLDARAAVFLDHHCFIFASCLHGPEHWIAMPVRMHIRAVCLEEDLRGFTATAFRQSIVLVGGQQQASRGFVKWFTDVRQYQIAGCSWSQLANLPVPLAYHASVVFRHILYVAGGQTLAHGGAVKLNLQVFAFDGTAWAEAGHVCQPRIYPTLFVHNDELYLVGGERNDGQGQRFLERYDFASGTFVESDFSDSQYCLVH